MPHSWIAVLLLASSALPVGARAEDGARGISVSWHDDGALTGTALAVWGFSELASSALTPARCRWCEPPGFDDSARRSLVWSNPAAAATASDVLSLSLPVAFATYDYLHVGRLEPVAEDLLVVTEAVALTGVLTQVAKYAVARQRPFAARGAGTGSPDDRMSFWSGHAALAFAVVAAGGMVAQLNDDRAWPWIYGIGFTAAAGTGYLRVAADKHYLSDVLVSAAVGTAVGLAVPWLHRRRHSLPVHLTVVPGGIAIYGEM